MLGYRSKKLMKRSVFIIITFLLGTYSVFGQSFVSFEEPPQMQLFPQTEYKNYKVKYKAIERSTIYLELKRGNIIVARGAVDVPKASQKVLTMAIKAKSSESLVESNDYSYNLYMYSGGRNDWSKKSCRSVSVPNVQMKKKSEKKTKKTMSFSSFFN